MAKRKTSQPKPKTNRHTAARNHRPAGVRVRMYRQGLGDCFLLTFPAKVGK